MAARLCLQKEGSRGGRSAAAAAGRAVGVGAQRSELPPYSRVAHASQHPHLSLTGSRRARKPSTSSGAASRGLAGACPAPRMLLMAVQRQGAGLDGPIASDRALSSLGGFPGRSSTPPARCLAAGRSQERLAARSDVSSRCTPGGGACSACCGGRGRRRQKDEVHPHGASGTSGRHCQQSHSAPSAPHSAEQLHLHYGSLL